MSETDLDGFDIGPRANQQCRLRMPQFVKIVALKARSPVTLDAVFVVPFFNRLESS